jgi:hypothetical protein
LGGQTTEKVCAGAGKLEKRLSVGFQLMPIKIAVITIIKQKCKAYTETDTREHKPKSGTGGLLLDNEKSVFRLGA